MSQSRGAPKLPNLDGVLGNLPSKSDAACTSEAGLPGVLSEVCHKGHKQSQCLIERCLGHLGSLARRLSCVLVQPELECPALRRLGFASLQAGSPFPPPSADVDAVLIVSVGADGVAAQRAVEAVGQNKDSPTLLVVIIIPPSSDDGKVDPERCIALANRTSQARRALFDAGADDVMCIFGGEGIMPQRVIESVEKSAYMANKMSEIIHAEVRDVEEKASKKLQQAHKKFLMMLPGRVFENIPYEDDGLRERRTDDGCLVEVGQCVFDAKLGSGTFGHVFKAQHSKFGSCAVKLISKKSVKNASVMFSLDRELCHLLYAEPHPNIIRAHEVLHGQNNFYIVMDYAGKLHLQKFTKASLEGTSTQTLPLELIRSFSCQQAAALSHLHGNMVCHRDLKPDNWIVSDDGTTLHLADFGLAMQLSGPAHPLRQSCGSLPFCAPEVFDAESAEGQSAGYDGLGADVWSLGVNYMELVCGPYSIERLLGWLPQHPEEHGRVLQGLQSLEACWSAMEQQDTSGVGRVISRMLLLQPAQRWKIGQVSGSQGLALGRQAHPPRAGMRPRRQPAGSPSPDYA